MKKLSFIGFVLALLSVATGLYNQFVYVKAFHANECQTFSAQVCDDTHNTQVTLGIIAMVLAGVGMILCMIPESKAKKVINFFGILIGLFGLILGLAQATHFFDVTGYFTN
mgnify:CR=1 FL=1